MTDAEVVKSKLCTALPLLKKSYPINRLALFGSITREDYNPSMSDVDIMVELNGELGYEFVELAEELERLLQKKVDLISKDALKEMQWNFLKSKMIYV